MVLTDSIFIVEVSPGPGVPITDPPEGDCVVLKITTETRCTYNLTKILNLIVYQVK